MHNTGFLETVRVAAAIAAALLAGCAAPPENGGRTAECLSLWRDGAPAKSALLDYVAAVTREGSADYIPPQDRIAVFDFDGTLFCETDPTYLDWMLYDHRVLDDPSYRATDEQKATARAARATGEWPGLNHPKRERLMAEVWRGVTPEALAAYVRTFLKEPHPGFTGMKRGEAFYRPMVEVVRLLQANGFLVYVCSGTERFALRPIVEDGLALPPRQIIGTDYTLFARAQGERDGLNHVYGKDDTLVLGGTVAAKNLQMNKVSVMAREIGARPVLAFGNSMSDASMLNYALQNSRYRALGFMLLCDDTVREYGNLAKAEKMRAACGANGWIPVSMRDDWTTIYGPGVARRPSASLAAASAVAMTGLADGGAARSGAPVLEMRNIAHRGMWDRDVPQNTAEAIKRAYDAGATWVETDFHHTKAGQMVCIHHEGELKKYTGCRKRIVDLTPEDVAGLNLGEKDGLPKAYRIPLLGEVLALVPKHGVLQAEIKGYSPQYADIFDAAVKSAGLTETNIVVSSFLYDALKDFKARYPRYRTVWLTGLPRKGPFNVQEYIGKCKAAGVEVFCPGCGSTRGVMTRADADAVRAAGLELRVYGVNSPDDLRQAKSLGAVGFTCNHWRDAFGWARELGGVKLLP